MAYLRPYRVAETSTTTGTGSITLAGAVTGYSAFTAELANADTATIVIEAIDAAGRPTGEWEICDTTFTAPSTLSRGTLRDSSTGSRINFGAGSKRVFAINPRDAVDLASADVIGTLAVAKGGTGATTLTANNVILGNGTSGVQFVAPGTSGNVLTSNGTTWTSAAAGASLLGQTASASPWETSLGFEAGLNTTGTSNTFIGARVGKSNTTGTSNTATGAFALFSCTTGSANTAIGQSALGQSTTGGSNVAIGNSAMSQGTTISDNVAIGDSALIFNNANSNVAVGRSALQSNTSGTNNAAIGFNAGDAVTTGAQNTILGASAGSSGANDLTTGSNNTIIGYNAAASSPTANNTVTLGNSSITTLRCQVTAITSLSDARDKRDVTDLDAGLSFLNALRPVRFTWDMRDGGKVGEADTGFIAQDLQAAMADAGVVIPGLVYDLNPDKLEAGYGKLLPVLVKAIQELSAKVDALEAQLKEV